MKKVLFAAVVVILAGASFVSAQTYQTWLAAIVGPNSSYGINGPYINFGTNAGSYTFNVPSGYTSNDIDLAVGTHHVRLEATEADGLVGTKSNDRMGLAANGAIAFEVAGGTPAVTGNFVRIIPGHPFADSAYQLNDGAGGIPTNGFSYTIADGSSIPDTLFLTPAAALTSGTITLQPTPADGQYFTIVSSQNISGLSIVAQGGLGIVGTVTSLTANQQVKFQCINTTGASFECLSADGGEWFRIQ